MKALKIKEYLTGSNYYGKLMMMIGLLIAVPIVAIPYYRNEAGYILSFLIPAAGSIFLGFVICIFMPNQSEKITEWKSTLQKGSLPVLFVWCFAALVGAFPFVLSGQSNFIHALFESISGWTTNGLTLLDVTTMPKIFLFYRSFMQYCGGLGFIIMIVMLIQGKQAMNLYNAEGHPDRIMPSLKGTTRTIALLYCGFLTAGILMYRVFGMNLFDAVCHAMSSLSTAGFSTRVGSIGEFTSLPIEIITIVLMLIGSTNFAVLLLLMKCKFRQIIKVSEMRFMIGLIVVFVSLISLSLVFQMNMGVGESIIKSLFGVVSIFSTTGYSTINYTQLPSFAVGLIMLLMVIGGGIGSTSGGIKLSRAYLMVRFTRENIRKRLSPARNVTAPSYFRVQGKTPIDDTLIKDTIGYIACYFGVLIVGTLLMTLTADVSLFDAMFEFTAVLGNVGVSNGITDANTDTGTLIVEMIGMLLGRLEIFIVVIGFYSFFHESKNRVAALAEKIPSLRKGKNEK